MSAARPGLLERIESVDQDEGAGVSKPGEQLPPELMERAYYNQPVWKRIVVIAAGPAVNILIAFLILFGLAFSLEKALGSGVEVDQLTSDSAAVGKLQPGDRIVSIDGVPATNLSFNDRVDRFRDLTNSHSCAGQPTNGCAATMPVQLVVDRGGHQVQVAVTPKYNDAVSGTCIGVGFGPTDTQPLANSVPEAADWSVSTMWYITSQTVSKLAQLFKPEERKQVSGVVGGSRALNEAIGFSAQEALFVLALISLSLGVINLFPFLPLDGGHIFWSVVEKIRGRARAVLRDRACERDRVPA